MTIEKSARRPRIVVGVDGSKGTMQALRWAQIFLTDAVDEVFGTHRPAGLNLTVREGDAAHVLLEQSEGARMLIVGSRGHGGFAGLLLGSVSAKVAEHATCPVLITHGETLPMEVTA